MKFENQRMESIVVLMTFFSVAGGMMAFVILFPYIRGAPGFTSETVWVEKTFFLTLSMAFTGIISVINWDNMFLDEKDFLYLSGLPIKTRTLFSAKFFSLLAFVGLVSLSLHFFSVFIFTFFLGEMINIDPFYHTSLLELGGIHLLTGFMANLFVFLLVAVIQSVLMTLLNATLFKKVSIVVQAILLMIFVSCFTWFPKVAPLLLTMKEENAPFFYYFPPVWFVGFYEQMIGNYDSLFKTFFYMAPISLVLLVDLYLLSMPISFKNFSRPASNGKPKRFFVSFLSPVKARFDALVLKNPIQAAIFYFVLITLRRSRKHKLQLAVYVALPLAFVLTELTLIIVNKGIEEFHKPGYFLTAIPLILYFFMMWGLRVSVLIPVAVEANWAFLISEGDYPVHYMWGLKKAIIAIGILPYFILLFLFYTFCWGIFPALLHSLFCGITAYLSMEIFFFNYNKMPFVSHHVPGKFKLKSLWPLYLLIFAIFIYVFTLCGMFLLKYPLVNIFYYGAALTDIYWIRWLGYKRNRGFRFVFDEESERAMMGLGFDAE